MSSRLVAKPSAPYSPDGPHDFMHNKVLVCDHTVATGSYNFSTNAEGNAENQLHLHAPELANQYASYIDTLLTTYRHA